MSHSPFHVAQVHFFAPAFAKYNDECLADALRETAESYAQLAAPCLRRLDVGDRGHASGQLHSLAEWWEVRINTSSRLNSQLHSPGVV